MKLIKKFQNSGVITYSNDDNSSIPYYTKKNWWGNLVSGLNGKRYSVHDGIYNFYTEDDGNINWGGKTGTIFVDRDGTKYVDFLVDKDKSSRPDLETYQRFKIGTTTARPKQIVEESTSTQTSNEDLIILLKSTKSNSNILVRPSISKDLQPYLSHVTKEGIPYFRIPEGYTEEQFRDAVNKVFKENSELSKLRMPSYKQQDNRKQDQNNKLQDNKLQEQNKTTQLNINSGSNKSPIKYSNQQVLLIKLEERKVIPERLLGNYAYKQNLVNVYNIHPDVYRKVLEELKKMETSSSTNLRYGEYYLTPKKLQGYEIGSQINDTIFNVISSKGLYDCKYQHELFSHYSKIKPGDILPNSPSKVPNALVKDGRSRYVVVPNYSSNDDIIMKDKKYLGIGIHDSNSILNFFKINNNGKIKRYKEIPEYINAYKETLRQEGFSENQIKEIIKKELYYYSFDYDGMSNSDVIKLYSPVNKKLGGKLIRKIK